MAPNYAVDMSYEEYINNEDPSLAAVLNYNVKSFYPKPFAPVQAFYEKGDLDSIKFVVGKMASDDRYRYIDFENNLNRIGSNFIKEENKKDAIFFLKLNSEIYPESLQVLLTLAAAYDSFDDSLNAKKYYKKVLAADPNGDMGREAQSKLSVMKE